jgi:hypothetical protein
VADRKDNQLAKVRRAGLFSTTPVRAVVESLENRQLLHGFGFGGFGFGGHGFGHEANTIEFDQAPAAVQTGLTTLASTDKLTAPAATQTVFLGNSNGIETYSVDLTGTGTESILTVDQTGAAVTAATNGSITWAVLNGTGTGSDTAAASEIAAIATALSLTAPTDTTNVLVKTASNGNITYTIKLPKSDSSTTTHLRNIVITVDSNGNPVGNQNIPFSAMPTTIQAALNTNRPSGATALDTTSTQNVKVRTHSGVTTYSTDFTTSGTTTTVTVSAAGALTKLPSHSSTTFGALSTAVQTELQTLATADGVAGTIASTQTVDAYDEANGTTIYSVTMQASKTGDSGATYTFNLTISVDENGNPTTLPRDAGSGDNSGDSGDNSGNGGGGNFFGDHFGGFTGSSFGGFGFFGFRRHGH